MTIFVSGTRLQLSNATTDVVSRYRHEIFIRKLQWQVPHQVRPGLELDEFDTDQTVYLAALSSGGVVRGCARLLPTTRPYLLKDVFSHLLIDGEPPCRDDVWELSRFAADVPRDEAAPGLGRTLFAEALRVAHAHGAETLIGVVAAHVKRFILRMGLPLDILGPSVVHGGDEICACSLPVRASLAILQADATRAACTAAPERARRPGRIATSASRPLMTA